MPRVVVASYNVHGGVDGWGRPFDVEEACARVAADVLVIEEAWSADDGPSLARRVGDRLGYAVTELPLGRGRIALPAFDPGRRWGPPLRARTTGYGMRLVRRRSGIASTRPTATVPDATIERGSWGIALLSRLQVARTRTIELAQLPADPARRGAIEAELVVPGARCPLVVVGTHLAHLSQGSPRHIAQLRRELGAVERAGGESLPGAMVGDMNMWGPPFTLLFPGWRRAVRGRSWPAWTARPLAQSDHILVNRSVRVVSGHVVRVGGSDHYPVRAELEI